jgi:lipopolysaccharide biosynthesis glycosyltransferase
VHIVIVTDRAFLPWCATTLVSCARVTRGDLSVHVMHAADVSAEDRTRLADLGGSYGAALEFHTIDQAALAPLPSKGGALGARISWARLLLPNALPGVDRVIYLDADTLVVDSLTPLWELPLGASPVAAVANVSESAMRAHVESLGIEARAGYFNAGVLVINLAQWRAEGAVDALVSFATNHPSLPGFDQDALNAVFAGRWSPLHPRWNAMNSLRLWRPLAVEVFGEAAVQEATSAPAVLHFEGPSLCKPWHHLCDHPRRVEYRSTLALTPWRDTPVEGRTAAGRLIGMLPEERWVPTFLWLDRIKRRLAGIKGRIGARLRRRSSAPGGGTASGSPPG